MKVYSCGCVFDYCNYLIECQGGFFVKADRYKKDDLEKTFTFSKTYYTCFFALLKAKKLDADDINNKLRWVSKF